MPEMLQQCGREVQVYRRADETCRHDRPRPASTADRNRPPRRPALRRRGARRVPGCVPPVLGGMARAGRWPIGRRPPPEPHPSWASALEAGPARPANAPAPRPRLLHGAVRSDSARPGAPTPAAAAAAATGNLVCTCQATEVLAPQLASWSGPCRYRPRRPLGQRRRRRGGRADLGRRLFVAIRLQLQVFGSVAARSARRSPTRGAPRAAARRSRAGAEPRPDRGDPRSPNHARGLSFDAGMLATAAPKRPAGPCGAPDRRADRPDAPTDKRLLDPRGRVLPGHVPSRVPRAIFPCWRESWLEHVSSRAGIAAGSTTAAGAAARAPRPPPSDQTGPRPTRDGKSGRRTTLVPGQLRRHPHRRPARSAGRVLPGGHRDRRSSPFARRTTSSAWSSRWRPAPRASSDRSIPTSGSTGGTSRCARRSSTSSSRAMSWSRRRSAV